MGGGSVYVAFIMEHFITGKNPSKLYEAYQNGDYKAGITNGLFREAKGCLEEDMGIKFELVKETNKLVEGGDVTFLREEKGRKFGFPATYRYYKAPSKKAAQDFLSKQKISENLFFVAVESPDGRWVKDNTGIYDA